MTGCEECGGGCVPDLIRRVPPKGGRGTLFARPVPVVAVFVNHNPLREPPHVSLAGLFRSFSFSR